MSEEFFKKLKAHVPEAVLVHEVATIGDYHTLITGVMMDRAGFHVVVASTPIFGTTLCCRESGPHPSYGQALTWVKQPLRDMFPKDILMRTCSYI